MNNRLLELIRYRTGGKQNEFAEIMGWSPQYLHKMLKEGGIGIRPIITLLEKFPELNARWFLLGEGAMIDSRANDVMLHLLRLLEIEKYMPVMTPEELREIQDGKCEFDEEAQQRWAQLLEARNEQINARFVQAYKRQEGLCKQSKASE